MQYGKDLWNHVRMSCWLMQPRFCSGPVGSGECCQPDVPCRSGRFRPCGAELQEEIRNAEQTWATGAFYPAVWTIADSFHLWSPHCFGAWLCESCLFDTVQSRRVFELTEVGENCWECDWFRIYPLSLAKQEPRILCGLVTKPIFLVFSLCFQVIKGILGWVLRVPVFGHSFPTTVCGFSRKDGNPYVVVHLQTEKLVWCWFLVL